MPAIKVSNNHLIDIQKRYWIDSLLEFRAILTNNSVYTENQEVYTWFANEAISAGYLTRPVVTIAATPVWDATQTRVEMVMTFSVAPTGGDVTFDRVCIIESADERTGFSIDGTTYLITAVNATTDTITINSHSLSNNDRLVFTPYSAGVLPGGLSANTEYFAVNITANTFQIATTQSGLAIDLTSQGTAPYKIILAKGKPVIVAPLKATLAVANGAEQFFRIDYNAGSGNDVDVEVI